MVIRPESVPGYADLASPARKGTRRSRRRPVTLTVVWTAVLAAAILLALAAQMTPSLAVLLGAALLIHVMATFWDRPASRRPSPRRRRS
jgi:hypothetical protein